MTPSERRAGEKSEKRMCVEPMPSDDESWSLISKQKPGPKRSVLYIGNLSPETTEERLVNFIQARSTAVGVKPPNIINARMFEPREGRDRIGARLTVASSDMMLKFCRRRTSGPDQYMLGHGIFTLYGWINPNPSRWNPTPTRRSASLEQTSLVPKCLTTRMTMLQLDRFETISVPA